VDPDSDAMIEGAAVKLWLFSLQVLATRLHKVAKQEGELNQKKFVEPVYLKLAEHGAETFARRLSALTGESEQTWKKIIGEQRRLSHEVFSSMPLFAESPRVKDASAWNWTIADVMVEFKNEKNALFESAMTKLAMEAFLREASYFETHLQILYKQMNG
jgi:hypothetical protein